MKKAILNFSDHFYGLKDDSNCKRYINGQKRLRNSLKSNFNGDLLFYNSEKEVPCKSHREVHYGFKPAMIEKAMNMGYELMFWCDSSVYVRKNMQPIFDRIERDGYFILAQGNLGDVSSGEWCCDSALEPLKLTREESFKIPHCVATVFGLDLRKNKEFFNEYFALGKDGRAFNGPWNNRERQASSDPRVQGHRHDQTVLSVLAWRHGMKNWIESDEKLNHWLSGHYDGYKYPNSILVMSPV